jgi:hypothetical protein
MVHGEIAWSPHKSGAKSQKSGSASGFIGGSEGLVDFPDEAPFDFRDLFGAYTEDASTLR